MTIPMRYDGTPEVDFFSLHSRKKKRIDVEMLDYGFVQKCEDVDELKGILAMLRSGKEGRYPDLERATEDRILAVLPEKERNKIITMRSGPSRSELKVEQEELKSWTKQIDEKNKALQEHKKASRSIPPVRGQAKTEKTPMNQPLITEVTAEDRKKQAIPAYDFRGWEKYDVEKAIAEVDQSEELSKEQARLQREEREKREKERKKELASLPSYVDLDELSKAEREVYALHEKQKGNECFKANENEEAVLYYTRSMAFDDSNAILYANRAMAHLRLKNFAQAEDDCTRAILLDANYCKAWTRRGMTRFRRGKYAGAIEDFQESLRLDPTSKEVKKLLSKTRSKWKEVDGTIQNNQASNDMSTSEPPAPQSESKPFKRFEIIEDDEESDEDDDDKDVPTPSKPFQRFEILEE
ncbi:hypothetical protein Poli38472_001522 [Pythium oligandrum]|uniref:Uncharacterized protein n=1 Tax=Pythium oligandrum TaxID=41045 RepID=A0A8K1CT38_PYTOL|nr:hypothetical protein Poli38472_001522 [Pythium oligandrum]|eukprot:TMW69366.1 hypothetical protein Poli38472_001522 [Pythium oligandrum]